MLRSNWMPTEFCSCGGASSAAGQGYTWEAFVPLHEDPCPYVQGLSTFDIGCAFAMKSLGHHLVNLHLPISVKMWKIWLLNAFWHQSGICLCILCDKIERVYEWISLAVAVKDIATRPVQAAKKPTQAPRWNWWRRYACSGLRHFSPFWTLPLRSKNYFLTKHSG